LTRGEIEVLVERIVGNRALPESVRRDIVERADGVPLFAEEIAKAALEAEDEGSAPRVVSTVSSPAQGVPASLHASLMTRLDRLGAAKDIAQIGAAIGRDFSHRLLASGAGKSEPELSASLNRLVQAGLLFRQGVRQHATYLFRHALVQDVAYGTLLREQRRALHARIAESLENQFPSIAESQPEILARHCAEAGLTERAAHLWGAAARQSLARAAFVESVEQLRRALALIEGLTGTPALRREEISLQIALFRTLSYVKGFASPQAMTALERARVLHAQTESLGEALEYPLAIFEILLANWRVNFSAVNGDALVELAKQFLALAEEQSNPVLLLSGQIMMGFSFCLTGSFEKARIHYDRAMALYPSVGADALIAFGG
jgi:predicted ATPase